MVNNKKHKVVFLPHNREILVDDGEILIHAAMEAGVHINASCGGEGACGKCRVIIEKGEVEGGTAKFLSQEDIQKGYRLACQSRVRGDVVIRVPVESFVDTAVLNLQRLPRRTARVWQMNLDDLKEQGLFVPPLEKKYVELKPPTAEDHVPDVTRLVRHLRHKHNEHRLVVELPVIRKIPDVFRKSDFKVTVTLERPVRKGGRTRIVHVEPGNTTGHAYAIALDIGTTTVMGQLLNLVTGEVLAERAEFNAQISYGEDVISRIVFAEKEGGLDKLNKAIVDTINKIIKALLRHSKVNPEAVLNITIAGNTTMTQLFLKVNPSYIRRSPYVPASSLYPPIDAHDLGIELNDHAVALVYPQVSSYVGGDIVAGVMGSGMYRTDKLTLFIDIGTNAEIVIGNKEWMACAACSAGPAFEGGGVEFGMRAARGAIEDFSIDPVTLEPMLLTIGHEKPKGICGSGLISIVATLFEMGIIDNQGKFNTDLKNPRIRERDGVYEYVLAWQEETQVDRDIVITEIDIDNLIRAKGAIYSGCMTLLDEVGLSIGDLEQIILAGGFGSYVDLEKAMAIGLLPEMDAERITYVGNGSLMGAKMSALTNRIRQDVVRVLEMMTSFELSETPSYMDHYIAALFLPHTNMDLFPRVKARLIERRDILQKIRSEQRAMAVG